MTDQNRTAEQVRDGRPGSAFVSGATSGRSPDVTLAAGSPRDVPPGEGLVEKAADSVADGASIAAVARYFNVSELELRMLLETPDDQAAAEPTSAELPETPPAEAEAVQPEPRAAEPEPRAAEPEPQPAEREPQPAEPEPQPATRPQTAVPAGPAPARPAPTVHISSPAIGTSRRPSSRPTMGARDFVRLLRRRAVILVAALIVGAAAGWVTAPGATQRPVTYRATHTLIYEPHGKQSYNIEQLALLATSGEVPSRVATRLQLDRGQVRSALAAAAQAEVGTISVTARSSTAAGAESLANATAEELSAEISQRDQVTIDAEVRRLSEHVDAARRRLNAAPPKDTQEQTAARAELQGAQKALADYQSSPPAKSRLRTLEEATASTVRPAGVRAPDSKPGRAGLLGVLGLLAGIAGAVVLDRLDSRIRSKESAEAAFGVPVVAEVPTISKAAQGQLLARTDPSSSFVEAYRGLRTYVALWAPEGDREDGHRVLVVTSPGPSEGKTTTSAHLAAMLAEIGRTVVVVSADLRRPRIHQYFDLPAGPGIVEALATLSEEPTFTGLDRPTSVRGVRLVPSGAALENPAPLFEHARDLVESVRGLADFVLIDAPPLLVANDAVEMARFADGVLLVARAGETSIEAAERSAEVLERLAIPVVGSVLIASDAASTASRYYASHYYTAPDRGGRRRRRPIAPDGSRPGSGAGR